MFAVGGQFISEVIISARATLLKHASAAAAFILDFTDSAWFLSIAGFVQTFPF